MVAFLLECIIDYCDEDLISYTFALIESSQEQEKWSTRKF